MTDWWSDLLGSERVIQLPRTEDIAETQACIIGLTEGILDTQSAADFLTKTGASKTEAQRIVRAVKNIPVGLQATYPNFGRIPSAGARFASRDDLWPIGSSEAGGGTSSAKEKGDDEDKPKPENWKL